MRYLLLFCVLTMSLLLTQCTHSEQIFAYWQNGIDEPANVVDQLEREVERKYDYYETDWRGDRRSRYSENAEYFNGYH